MRVPETRSKCCFQFCPIASLRWIATRYSEISGAPSGGLNGGFSGACDGVEGSLGVIDGTVGGASITGGGGNGPRGISAAGIRLTGD